MSLYLSVNLVVAAAYLVARPVSDSRLARLVLFTAVAMPILFYCLPSLYTPAVAPREFLKLVVEEGTVPSAPAIGLPPAVTGAPIAQRGISFPFFLLLGIGAALVRFAWSWFSLGRLLRRTVPLHSLGRVRVVISDDVSVPFSVRRFRTAWVVLSSNLVESPRDFRIALRHEIQHHRQRDTHWMVALELFVASTFWNPFSHLWRRRCAELQEISCDAALVGGRGIASHEYASCLLKVAEAALARREWMGATGMESFLTRRIKMLPDNSSPSRRKAPWALGALLCVLTTAVALGAQGFLREKAEIEIDPRLQKIAERAIRDAVKKHGADGGFAVVADAQTGRVIAAIGQDRALLPASVVKPLVLATAVDRGVVKSDDTFFCENGTYKQYSDWKAFDTLSAADAIAYSSNIGVIKIGEKLGADVVVEGLRDFGLPVAGKDIGLLTTGSAFSVTPLEMIAAYGAIANGGTIGGRRVLKESTAAELRHVLGGVVSHGTGTEAQSAKYTTAGKTGTAQDPTVRKSRKGNDANVASFAGFAPLENPRLVLYVGLIRPTDGDGTVHGGHHAAPIFRAIVDEALPLLGTPSDKK